MVDRHKLRIGNFAIILLIFCGINLFFAFKFVVLNLSEFFILFAGLGTWVLQWMLIYIVYYDYYTTPQV